MANDLNDPVLTQQLESKNYLDMLKDKPGKVYPYQCFLELVEIISRHTYPDLPATEQLFCFGRAARHAYAQKTIIGKVQLAASNFVTPSRSIYRSRDIQNNIFPYKRSVVEISPTNYQLLFHNDPGPADYWRGILYEALVASHAKNPQVTIVALASSGFSLDATWED
jgi:uncharacterized protein (TIGR02265 family)